MSFNELYFKYNMDLKLNFVRQIISYGNFYLIIRKGVKVHFYKGLMIPFTLDNLNKRKSFVVNTNSFFSPL